MILLLRENHSEGRFLTLGPNKDISGLLALPFSFFLVLGGCLFVGANGDAGVVINIMYKPCEWITTVQIRSDGVV